MGVGGTLKREGIYVYLGLIHAIVQQKLTQHFKAIILQLKKKKLKILRIQTGKFWPLLCCLKHLAAYPAFTSTFPKGQGIREKLQQINKWLNIFSKI